MQSFSPGMFKLDDFQRGDAGCKGSEDYLDGMMASSISAGIQGSSFLWGIHWNSVCDLFLWLFNNVSHVCPDLKNPPL